MRSAYVHRSLVALLLFIFTPAVGAVPAQYADPAANLEGNITTQDNPNGQNERNGITGTSGAWTAASFDLSLYAGQTVALRLRYWTDGAVAGKGLIADAISLGSWSDGAENGPAGWALTGFKETSGLESLVNFNAYLAEYRQYLSYDRSLRTGPYNFGFADTLPDYVEHYRYQDGLLISYWDDFYTDNNTSEHPGEGLILPVDAHPDPLIGPDGLPWRARIQSFDSTFGLQPTDSLTLHRLGLAATHPSLPAVPIFDDLLGYYRAVPESLASAQAGVVVPRTGTQIRVASTSGRVMQVQVLPSPRSETGL
jgi:immune inhibitor A